MCSAWRRGYLDHERAKIREGTKREGAETTCPHERRPFADFVLRDFVPLRAFVVHTSHLPTKRPVQQHLEQLLRLTQGIVVHLETDLS